MICGIDIGGTKIETAIYDKDLNTFESWRVPTPVRDYREFLDIVTAQVYRVDDKLGYQAAVGLGMPGLVNLENQSLCSNIPCAIGNNIQKDIEQILDRRISVENDCRCFTLSEALSGAGQLSERVYGAILGTGAAGGLCINGKIYNGRNRHVGEFGHIPLPAALQQKYSLEIAECGCGLTGCIENYVSGKGLANLFNNKHNEQLKSENIIELLRSNDSRAIDIFDVFIDLLGFTMASIIKHYDPDIIVLGGGLSKVDEIYAKLPAAIPPYLFKTSIAPPVVKATFGDSSGVRGAATLALQRLANEKELLKC